MSTSILDRSKPWRLKKTPRVFQTRGMPIELPDGSSIAIVVAEKNPELIEAGHLMAGARELHHALVMAVDFIENCTDDDPDRSDRFFACREAWRKAFLAINPSA